ncbi:FAST kinase domain-containing protein 4 [Salminus brasiliensis]|uniref:FAST kinase domain-containing protein 4 n=1 Tax=Salminus brasiliensis TaxID=930266 RepID=UPI003B836179
MTTKLLGRWARLLSRCPQASAAPARLQAPTAYSAELLWPHTQIQPAVRPLCTRWKIVKEEDSPTLKRSELEEVIGKATTPEEVLQAWDSQGGDGNQAARCLIQISKLRGEKRGENTEDILQHPLCVRLMETVNSKIPFIWNSTLVFLLPALSNLGVAPNAAVLCTLQSEVLKRLRRFNYHHLAYLLNWSSKGHNKDDPSSKYLTTAILKQLELRWTELNDPRSLNIIMGCATILPPSLMERLEEKALELAEKLSAEDLCKVALSLALLERRAVPLLRALSYYLQQKPSRELKTPLLLDVIYSFGRLNFYNAQMFKRVAGELLHRMEQLSSTDVVKCSKSLSFLKWLHQPLFDGFAEHFLKNHVQYSTLQLCNLLMSFSNLNFQPSSNEEFYKKVHEVLEGSWEGFEPPLQTDVVWSLCVLQQAKPEFITAVTDPAFQTELAGVSSVRTENYRLKLLQIAASAHLDLGQTDVDPTINLPAAQPKPLSPMSLQKDVQVALQSLTDKCPSALRTNVDTVYGWTVDAELVVDSENKPIDLNNLVAPHLPGGGGSKQLPQGAHRLAFLVWEFPQFLFKTEDLLGRFIMKKRHMQLAGFLVVEVPYFEWLALKSDRQKTAYLKDKIGKAVAEDMAR